MKFDVKFGEVQELKGEDGISPTVTVTEIEGGHCVTITDKDGAKSFDVMDGKDGTGSGGGGISVTDDGNGNVAINSTGTVSITDDGNGNVVIV